MDREGDGEEKERKNLAGHQEKQSPKGVGLGHWLDRVDCKFSVPAMSPS